MGNPEPSPESSRRKGAETRHLLPKSLCHCEEQRDEAISKDKVMV